MDRPKRKTRPPQHLDDFVAMVDDALSPAPIKTSASTAESQDPPARSKSEPRFPSVKKSDPGFLDFLTPQEKQLVKRELQDASQSQWQLRPPVATQPRHQTESAAPQPPPRSPNQRSKDLLELEIQLVEKRLELERLEIKKLSLKPVTEPTSQAPPTIPTMKDLSKDPHLKAEVKSWEQELCDPLLLGVQTDDPMQSILGNAEQQDNELPEGRKPLLIKHYVTSDFLIEVNETVLARTGSSSVILKGHNTAVARNKITMPDYWLANARIFQILINKGKLQSSVEMQSYLNYNSKIARLSKSHPWEKVLEYDEAFRTMQHMSACNWNQDSQFLYTHILQAPSKPAPQGKSQSSKPKVIRNPATGKPICFDFNSRDGCTRTSCQFDHVCLKQDCFQPHPQHKHPNVQSPRSPEMAADHSLPPWGQRGL